MIFTQSKISAYFVPIFLLAIPILDTTVAVLSRIRRHVSPFQGGQDHLSHRLLRSGCSRRTAAFSLWGLSAMFAFIAVFISNTEISFENYILMSAVAVWILIFALFFKTSDV